MSEPIDPGVIPVANLGTWFVASANRLGMFYKVWLIGHTVYCSHPEQFAMPPTTNCRHIRRVEEYLKGKVEEASAYARATGFEEDPYG